MALTSAKMNKYIFNDHYSELHNQSMLGNCEINSIHALLLRPCLSIISRVDIMERRVSNFCMSYQK